MTSSTVPQAVQSCHELLLWLIPQLDKFLRSRLFTLGERIEAGLSRLRKTIPFTLRRAQGERIYKSALTYWFVLEHTFLAHEMKSLADSPTSRVNEIEMR